MARARAQDQAFVNLEPVLCPFGTCSLDDRTDAIIKHAGVNRRSNAARSGGVLLRIPVSPVSKREDIARIAKSRLSPAIDQPRVPADMIHMDMGADNDINVLWLESGGCQIAEEIGLEIAEDR